MQGFWSRVQGLGFWVWFWIWGLTVSGFRDFRIIVYGLERMCYILDCWVCTLGMHLAS